MSTPAGVKAGALTPRPRRARLGHVGRGLAVALLAVVFSATLAEAVLRLAGYHRCQLLADSVRGSYRIGPHQQFHYFGYLPGQIEDFDTVVTLNERGFHDRDYAAERPTAQTYRIMVLGDSYVAAWEVPLEETFHKRLEARLEREDPLGRGSYQVIAFGQGRTAQEQEIEWMRQYAPIYRPDMILYVFFCGNDFMENEPTIFTEASNFGTRWIQKIAPRKIAFFRKMQLVPSSRLNDLVAEVAAEYYVEHLDRFDAAVSPADLESPELGLYRNPIPPQWAAALERTRKLLDVAREETAQFHARFVLASLSGPQAMSELTQRFLWAEPNDPRFDWQRGDRFIRDWAERSDVPHIELGPPLAKIGRHKVFWAHDQHLNSYGHAVVADLLYPFLVGAAKN